MPTLPPGGHIRKLNADWPVVFLPPFAAALAAVAYEVYRRRPALIGGDSEVYAGYSARLINGEIPYLDYFLEYPPLSLLPFTLPRILTLGLTPSDEQYKFRFVLVTLALAVAVGLAVLRTRRYLGGSAAGARPLLSFAAAAVLLAPVMLWRYDLAPTLCTSLALLAFLKGRNGWSGFWLGLGAATKLYPAVVGPVFCAERLARRDRRSAGALVAGGLAAIALVVLPFALLAPTGLAKVWSYHVERGVQIESVAGGALLLGARLGWAEASIVETHGADEIASPWAAAVYPVLPLLTVTGILLVAVLAYCRFRELHAGGRDTASALVAYTALVLLVFILTSKVLSPQYLVWLLPLIPLLRPRHSAALLGACALTAALFPWRYWELLRLELPAILLLNGRNVLLLLAACALLREHLPTPPWRRTSVRS